MDRLKNWVENIQREFIFGKKRIYKRDKYLDYQGVIYKVIPLKSGGLYLKPKDILRETAKIDLIPKDKPQKAKNKNDK